MFGEIDNCFVYFFFFFVHFLRILYTCRIRVLSPYPRFISISAFYPHIRVLSPYPLRVLSPNPRLIPISVFYSHIRSAPSIRPSAPRFILTRFIMLVCSYKIIFKEYFAFLVKTLCIYSDIAQDYTPYNPHKNIRKKYFFPPLYRRLLPLNVR